MKLPSNSSLGLGNEKATKQGAFPQKAMRAFLSSGVKAKCNREVSVETHQVWVPIVN